MRLLTLLLRTWVVEVKGFLSLWCLKSLVLEVRPIGDRGSQVDVRSLCGNTYFVKPLQVLSSSLLRPSVLTVTSGTPDTARREECRSRSGRVGGGGPGCPFWSKVSLLAHGRRGRPESVTSPGGSWS